MSERINVLLAGSGGREHAMAMSLRQSPHVGELYIAPGNAGTAKIATNLDISATDIDGLVRAARDNNVGLFTAGSENTFVLGAVDAMREVGVNAYGADQDQARLETDKIFAHKMMVECGIPCPRGVAANNYDEARSFLADPPWEFVIKASGPASGKGVVLPENGEEAQKTVDAFMLDGMHGKAGKAILFQERLYGFETSLIATVSGQEIIGEPLTTDYKLKLTGNMGPNTGGMGCIIDINSQPPSEWLDMFIRPVTDRFACGGDPINSKVYAQLIHTKEGIFVLEYNMRDGDPEAQTKYGLKMPTSDTFEVMRKSLNGNLQPTDLAYEYEKAAACLVIAADGYPENPRTGDVIKRLDAEFEDGVVLFHAGTRLIDGLVQTNGGRVLNLTASAPTLEGAVQKIYKAASHGPFFDGMWNREDIGELYNRSDV